MGTTHGCGRQPVKCFAARCKVTRSASPAPFHQTTDATPDPSRLLLFAEPQQNRDHSVFQGYQSRVLGGHEPIHCRDGAAGFGSASRACVIRSSRSLFPTASISASSSDSRLFSLIRFSMYCGIVILENGRWFARSGRQETIGPSANRRPPESCLTPFESSLRASARIFRERIEKTEII